MDKAQVEFEIQLEQRLKTVLNINPEELKDDESKPKKRRKKNSSNEGGEEQEKLPSRNKPKKRDPGLISFLNNYHKTMWIAKYNCTFVYEDDDDDAEIGEEVIYVFKYLPVVYLLQLYVIRILNRVLVMFQIDAGSALDSSKLAYSKYKLIHGKFQDNLERVKSVLRTKLSSSSSRFTSLVIADSLFGLNKEDWDKENDMWKLKEYEELLLFFKVMNYSIIVDFALRFRAYII